MTSIRDLVNARINQVFFSSLCLLLQFAFVAVIMCGLAIPGCRAQADTPDDQAAISEAPQLWSNLTPEQWREHIREETRRVQELQRQRRLDRSQDSVERLSQEGSQASDRVLNDDTLESGDIVVTNKGVFVFKGQKDEQRGPGDFVPFADDRIRR
jgi:hypothetical protein